MDARNGEQLALVCDAAGAHVQRALRLRVIAVAALGLLIVLPWSAAADLDPAIQADLYLVQTEDYIKQKDYAAAHEAMGKILVLQEKHDLKIPLEFHFKYAQVLDLAGEYEEAVAAVTHYLQTAGRGGAHYREALTLLHTASQKQPFRDCDYCPWLVVVPAGSYRMGSPSTEAERHDDEGPQHLVTIHERFAVGAYEVTLEEWDACVESGGCGGYAPNDYGAREIFRERGPFPVVGVSWDDAQQFVGWLRSETGEPYRLLSEAEWEYVARAGSSDGRYWGESSSGQCRYANGADQSLERLDDENEYTSVSCDDGFPYFGPIGTFIPNGYGLYDVLGNVYEWVEDCYHESYVGAPNDGTASKTGDCSRRVTRGGSWSTGPGQMRSAARKGREAGGRWSNFGFRVARTLKP